MRPSLAALLDEASAYATGPRQVRAASRLMSLMESAPQRLPELFSHLPQAEWPQPRLVLGITGAPGSGKSTLTDKLISELRHRHPDRRLGVIAVDPSSPFTGGSILGDRVRMMRHATDPMVYIRSLATRGHLGGLSLGVRGVLRVMGLIGCDVVVVETVGVGQSEVEVASVADLVLVVLAPGQGDSIQMLKAGLMEVGDIFVVNKADREGANALYRELLSVLGLGQMLDAQRAEPEPSAAPDDPADGRAADAPAADEELLDSVLARRRPGSPEVLLTNANDGVGIPELLDDLERRTAQSAPRWEARRRASVQQDVLDAVYEEARRRIGRLLNGQTREQVQRVLGGEVTVAALAQELLERAAAETDEHSQPQEFAP
jgi:LAO/AO transport system kinase